MIHAQSLETLLNGIFAALIASSDRMRPPIHTTGHEYDARLVIQRLAPRTCGGRPNLDVLLALSGGAQ